MDDHNWNEWNGIEINDLHLFSLRLHVFHLLHRMEIQFRCMFVCVCLCLFLLLLYSLILPSPIVLPCSHLCCLIHQISTQQRTHTHTHAFETDLIYCIALETLIAIEKYKWSPFAIFVFHASCEHTREIVGFPPVCKSKVYLAILIGIVSHSQCINGVFIIHHFESRRHIKFPSSTNPIRFHAWENQ